MPQGAEDAPKGLIAGITAETSWALKARPVLDCVILCWFCFFTCKSVQHFLDKACDENSERQNTNDRKEGFHGTSPNKEGGTTPEGMSTPRVEKQFSYHSIFPMGKRCPQSLWIEITQAAQQLPPPSHSRAAF